MIRRIGIIIGGILLVLAAVWTGSGGRFFATAAPDAREWVGGSLAQHAKLVSNSRCIGNVDSRAPDPTDGSKTVVMGWGWDVKAKTLPKAALFVAAGNKIAGVAQPGVSRPDVPKALPEVTSDKAGWNGVLPGNTGEVTTYLLLSTGEACPLGQAK
ncbi:MAG TPA: hypothetical protein VHC00_04680 [Rhizobiaceae bacterium]|nr:hypothetical protein [Rhizobiaceae bacterium]